MKRLETLPRYIATGRVTKRPIFEFISCLIHPNDAMAVFPLADDYSFGILQSEIHWEWFCARCSTLKRDWRYTSNTVFDSFPWPQNPTLKDVKVVASAAVTLREARREAMRKHRLSLRKLYRSMEETPENPVSEAQDNLDSAARAAYGMPKNADILKFIFTLNQKCAEQENKAIPIQPPGLPAAFADNQDFFSSDCVSMPTV